MRLANDEEFVCAAIQNGFEVLGFSDHACWKYDSSFVAHMRMKLMNLMIIKIAFYI